MKRTLPILANLLMCALAAWSAVPPPLTTLRAIRALGKTEAGQALPVAFEGTVTYYHPGFRYLFVQQDGQAIFVFAPVETSVVPGDRVRIKGVTHAEFSADILADSVTVVGHTELPRPIPTGFDELMTGKRDCLRVTVRGKVRAANMVLRPDVRNSLTFKVRVAYLELLTDGGYINVVVNSEDESALKNLLDADVEVTGAAGGMYDGKWHQTGVLLRTSSFSDVKILKRAGASPWALPITPMDKVLSGYHVSDLTRRVRVHGTITYYQPGYYRPGSALVLQNGAESLWVETLTDKPLRIGDLADATGIPNVAGGAPSLTLAEIQEDGAQAPVTPLNVTGAQLASTDVAGMHHYDLVSMEGTVVMEVRETAQDEYVLVSGGQLFSAVFHHPDPTSLLPIPAMRQIPLGSTIRVTGICIIQDTMLFSGKAPFHILLRSFDDIIVVSNPPLLSIRNLILVTSLLLLAVLSVSAWGWNLERKIRRQTAALAEVESRRSRILEDINGSRPLAEILEQITVMVSHILDGAPCWCQIANGARLGNCPLQLDGRRIVKCEIAARSGPALGTIFAAFNRPLNNSGESEAKAMSMASELATLAIETRRLYSDLLHRSEFDQLTDVHNRFSLDKHLDALIDEARQKAGIFGLIYIDLDRFKLVNDQHGHRIGDLYLQQVTERMKGQLRSADMLARLGGDEFAALVPVARSRAEVEEIASRLVQSFSEPVLLEGLALRGSASVGIAVYPEDGSTGDKLLSAADAAMYAAKHGKQHSPAEQQNSAPAIEHSA